MRMRQLPIAFVFIVALCGAAAGLTPAELANDLAQNKCSKPDAELIKPGTSDSYNAQAKGFNDCLRIYVENENNKIARLRADASGQFDAISASAMTQIHDIERAINTAIVEVGIVNGVSQPGELPPPADGLASFPGPECAKPDEALLKPAKGRKAASLANLDRYEAQRQGYESCIRLYITQAKNQIVQVKTNAEAQVRAVADDANPRIHAINVEVSLALEEAQKASGERNAKINAFHSSLAAASLSPAQSQPGGVLSSASFQPPSNQLLQNPVFQGQPASESVIVNGARLPRSADMPTGKGDPDAISCRSPQQLAGSRMMGPEICKRNREWAKLFKRGETISPDGGKIVMGEKQRTYNPQSCVTNFSLAQPSVMLTTCGTPGGQ
jgi:hypothetical protein